MSRAKADSAPEHLRATALERQRVLFDGVSEVHLTDFPEYANVGDSALAWGLLRFFRQQGIAVRAVDFHSTLRVEEALAWARSARGRAVVVNGGGNLGDLYAPHQARREELLASAEPSTLIIAAPQSGRFIEPDALRRYHRVLAESRAEVRIAVRDQATQAMMPVGVHSLLVPDTVHVLGTLHAAPSTRRVVRLLRADAERDTRLVRAPGHDASDWAPDTRISQLQMRVERKLAREPLTRNLRHGSLRWRALAARRTRAGCALLAPGEVIITDRLHAMLLGIHLGRRVVYLDNTTNKLTSYADTWFRPPVADVVRRATSLPEAEEIARGW